MTEITVGVNGVLGRMGRTVLAAVEGAPDMVPVGGADIKAAPQTAMPLPGGSGTIPLFAGPAALIEGVRPQVLVDFTSGEGAEAALRAGAMAGVRVVSGSTGISPAALVQAERLAQEHEVGIIVAANFALGAVVLGHLAAIAARYFDYAEVVESHHEAKIDAPSGTALSLARSLVEGRGAPFTSVVPEKETLPGTRGGVYEGVNVHSGRMPGRLAHHEVIFGAPGQTLSLVHDSISRDCFMPGVLLAVRRVMTVNGLIVGLDRVLGLELPAKAKP